MADAITVQHLVVRRGRRTILHDFSVALPKGKVTAIIGPNGCGKSTFLKAVNCMIPAASGSIRLGQREVHDFSRKALSREMAFLTQTHDVPPDVTVRDLVGMGRFPYRRLWSGRSREDRDAVDRAIQAVGLEAYAGEVMQHLSGGEQQRAWLAVLRPSSCWTNRRRTSMCTTSCASSTSCAASMRAGRKPSSSSCTT